MILKYLAHSSFLVLSNSGLRIITDPYTPDSMIRYDPAREPADIVTISHSHGDHNALSTVPGSPTVINTPGKKNYKGITVNGISTYHDDSGGNKRGENIVFCFTIDDITICHMGDLGHMLTTEQTSAIGRVDVLLIPVGGLFTINAKVATRICDDLKPAIVVPMHYKTPKVDLPIAGVDDFLSGKKNVKNTGKSEVILKSETLPHTTEILILRPVMS